MWTSPASALTLVIASADSYCLTRTLCCPVTGSTQTLLISHANCSWTSTLHIYDSDSQGQIKPMVYCVVPWEVQHRLTSCPPLSILSGWDVRNLHNMPRASPTPCLLTIDSTFKLGTKRKPSSLLLLLSSTYSQQGKCLIHLTWWYIFPFFQIQLTPAMFKCSISSVIEYVIEMPWGDASGNANNACKHQISKVNIVIILRILTWVSEHLSSNPCSEEWETEKFRYSPTLELFQIQRIWSPPFLHC